MLETSALYKQILAGEHRFEHYLTVNGVSYAMSEIYGVKTSTHLYRDDAVNVGGCVSGELKCMIAPHAGEAIPTAARVCAFLRAVDGQRTSEWLPMGAWYIGTRDPKKSGKLELHCYDALRAKGERLYTVSGTWTRTSVRAVAQRCAALMGVTLENANVWSSSVYLDAPPINYTVREVLSCCAAASCGNVSMCFSPSGGDIVEKLRLCPIVPVSSGYDLGTNRSGFVPGKPYAPYTHVIVNIDTSDGDTVSREAVSESDTGRTMEVTLFCVTDAEQAQAVADNLLEVLDGYVYQPFTAAKAWLDPALELGDGFAVSDLPVALLGSNAAFGPLYTAEIEAPCEDEIESEVPSEDSAKRAIERKIAAGKASLKIDIDAIIAQVTDGQGNYTALTLRSDGLHVGNAQGTVTIGSGSIHIPNGAISFGDGTLNGALQAAYNNTGGGDPNPSYIHNTYISKTKVISPHVYGGDLYATGQGNAAGTNPAFYMSDGVTGSGANTEPNAPKGWLCYDKNGAGTEQEAENRVFLHSEPGVALKLDAGGDMSLEADDSIYLLSYLKLRKGVNYGTAAQRDAITPENGQIFFVVE